MYYPWELDKVVFHDNISLDYLCFTLNELIFLKHEIYNDIEPNNFFIVMLRNRIIVE